MENIMEKLEKLRSEIENDSCKEAQTLLSEAKKNAEESLSARKESLKAAYESKVAGITEDFLAEQKKLVSEKRFSQGRRVLIYRSGLMDSFFAEIERELCEISASPRYDDYLKICAQKAHEYSPLNAAVKAYCRPQDVPAVKRALSVYGTAVEETEGIRLGGLLFQYAEQSAFADFTFDTALEQERERFASLKEMQIDH